MKQWKRLAFYLFLNVLVSACTTVSVLVLYDQTRGPLPGGILTIANLFPGMETPAPVVAATDIPAAASPEPEMEMENEYIAYQVEEGDTFDSIAQAYGLSPELLMAENGFTTKDLGVGEVLLIPVNTAPEPAAEVAIDSVIGAGDIESERVVIKQNGEGELLLAGWRLEDENGNIFTFPQVTLFKGGAVNIFTRAGTNTVVDLYWGLEQPLWTSGETVTLLDAQNETQATYTIP